MALQMWKNIVSCNTHVLRNANTPKISPAIICRCYHRYYFEIKKKYPKQQFPNLHKDLPTLSEMDKTFIKSRKQLAPLEFRFVYPEFLPDPDVSKRNPLREKLERIDMMNRRSHIDIPEFYIGSILAVTISDLHSQGKPNKFVGICIHREGCGLRAMFTLRNCIDNQGVEVRYEMYDPVIQKIQVLRLEKRLDDELLYLRDAPEQYSTFDVNMEPEILPEGSPVPVNPLKIELKAKPWLSKYERMNLKGVVGLEKHLTPKNIAKKEFNEKPWEKYDLMKSYRDTIPEEEQSEIWADVYTQLHQLELTRKKLSRKRSFVIPKKV